MKCTNGRTAKSILGDCLSLRRFERCLVLCDEFCVDTGRQFWDVARSLCREAVMVVQSELRKDYFQTTPSVQSWIGQFDTVLVFSRGNVREAELHCSGEERNTRIALFPNATSEDFFDVLATDWVKIGVFTRKCSALLGAASKIRVKTEDGTDLVFDSSGGAPAIRDGRISSAGMVGTFPAGMAAISVNSGSAHGTLALRGPATERFLVEIKDGRAKQLISSETDPGLDKFIKGRQSWRILTRFGVGTLDTVAFNPHNPDLRARGSVHFEFGIHNEQIKNPVHYFTLDKADVWLDNRLWIERGEYV